MGAEPALKAELARLHADWHFAFSRPGFLTFKLPLGADASDVGGGQLVFARSWGTSLGKATAADDAERAQALWQLVDGRSFDRLHVWPRDTLAVGQRGFEPAVTPAAREVAQQLIASAPQALFKTGATAATEARPGENVLDVVIVEPNEWWIGTHRAQHKAACWPGGIFDELLPESAVSRAYLKMRESLAWSNFPLRHGDAWTELGCAPGGASQALLERGAHVLGVDPAEVDPRVATHANFSHLKMRGADVRRRTFRGIRYLAADLNVAPELTLATVEDIVTHSSVEITGVLLTLKLLEWSLANNIPEYLARVRGWGYPDVRARQLSHNRQEFCVAALRPPQRRRIRRKD